MSHVTHVERRKVESRRIRLFQVQMLLCCLYFSVGTLLQLVSAASAGMQRLETGICWSKLGLIAESMSLFL